MTIRIIQGDCRLILKSLPAESVHCCVTSPPYYSLRNYGHPDQIGLEASPTEYIEQLANVFREVRRVLRKDGTLWVVIGDSYAGSWGAQGHRETTATLSRNQIRNHPKRASLTGAIRQEGLKPKDLIGIPWMLAFALRDDGWYLRSEVIWHKKAPMPESVTDRCTVAHEHVFMLAKQERYYFDADAIAEETTGHSPGTVGNAPWHKLPAETNNGRQGSSLHTLTPTRNKRSVWTLGPEPLAESHFAVFPQRLIEPMILAGCPVGGTILDPFAGSGTVGRVALKYRRNAVLVELNPDYCQLIEKRINGVQVTLPLEEAVS